jgi:hypothetical protein
MNAGKRQGNDFLCQGKSPLPLPQVNLTTTGGLTLKDRGTLEGMDVLFHPFQNGRIRVPREIHLLSKM